MQETQKFGYVRVSTKEQNADRQMIALSDFDIPKRNLYTDKQSGKDFNRPAYKRMMKRLKKGDLLIVKSIDRLGRNYGEIMEQWRAITKDKGADIRVADMPLLDTTYGKDLLGTFIADLTLQIMSFTSQMERETILQRQMEGIAAAKARGVVFGGKVKPMPQDFAELLHRWESGAITMPEFAASCGVSIRTIFKRVKEYRTTAQAYVPQNLNKETL